MKGIETRETSRLGGIKIGYTLQRLILIATDSSPEEGTEAALGAGSNLADDVVHNQELMVPIYLVFNYHFWQWFAPNTYKPCPRGVFH